MKEDSLILDILGILGILGQTLETFMDPSPARLLHFFLDECPEQHWMRVHKTMRRKRWIVRRRAGIGPLTPKGRLAAWGGIDPPERWERAWDGQWRVLSFDIPCSRNDARLKLWRWLRAQRFGRLQLSVWITPDPLSPGRIPVNIDAAAGSPIVLLNAQPYSPMHQNNMISSAWDFPAVNAAYHAYLQIAQEGENVLCSQNRSPAMLRQWLRNERVAWHAAVALDPFLPAVLLPPDYAGRQAWEKRRTILATAARRALADGSTPGTQS